MKPPKQGTPPTEGETSLFNFIPPTEDEAVEYYNGLPSKPRLLGRTSSKTRPWTEPHDDNEEPSHYSGSGTGESSSRFRTPSEKKMLSPISEHPILGLYNEIRPRLCDAVGGIQWSSIDVFRIGDSIISQLQRPVVVWIGAEDEGTPWTAVAIVLDGVRNILDNYKLNDVECEIRVSRVQLLGRPPVFEPVLKAEFLGEAAVKHGMSTTLGQSISPYDNPQAFGTLCVYLRTSRYAFGSMALACRHVCLPLSSNESIGDLPIRFWNQLGGQHQIVLPRTEVLQAAMHKVECLKSDLQAELKALPTETAELDYFIRFIFQRDSRELQCLSQELECMQDPDQRRIGCILYSPTISSFKLPQSQVSWTRDWCLIKLDDKTFPIHLTNMIDLREGSALLDQSRLPKAVQNLHHYDDHGLLQLRRVVPFGGDNESLDVTPSLVVGKQGARTGLTWGTVSGLRSVVNGGYGDNVERFTSSQVSVIGSLGETTVPFAGPGDSGAAIFDGKGRVVAMLTGGAGNGGVVDVTYGTPMAALLYDIKESLGQDVWLR